jgi:hypothetical protein
MTAFRPALMSCSIALMAACSAQPTPTQINLRSVYQNSYCGTEEPGLRWLNSGEFATLVRGPGAGQHLGVEPTPVPHVDADERLLQVSLGQKGSGGHAVLLNSDTAQVKQDMLVLPLTIEQPPAGSMQTMQLTYPCLVIALPHEGYSRVRGDDIGEIPAEK